MEQKSTGISVKHFVIDRLNNLNCHSLRLIYPFTMQLIIHFICLVKFLNFLLNALLFFKAHSHQIKIATDWLQTCFRLVSDSKIGANGTMLHQFNPAGFY